MKKLRSGENQDNHILFLPRWYPNRYDPMFGLFIRNHALMVATFARISVVYVQAIEGKLKKTEVVFHDDQGIQTWCIYYPAATVRIPCIRKCCNLFRFLSANCKGIRKAVHHSGKPALVHVHVLTRLGLIAMLLHWRYRIPYVVTEHWSRYLPSVNTFKGAFRKYFTRLVIKRAAAVTTPTSDLKDAMCMHGLNNPTYVILPNLVDTERFAPGEATSDPDYKPIEFVHVSCFEDKSKNISGLLRVIALLSQKRKDFLCRLVGIGEDYERLLKQAQELGINDRFVKFSGLLEGDLLVHAIRSAGFMVISSHYENLPVVISEAFACGIPVLSTDVGGISEIIDEHNGMVVKAGDDGSLSDGIEYMLDHCNDFDKKKIRAFAVDHFSKQVVTSTLQQIYASALQKVPS